MEHSKPITLSNLMKSNPHHYHGIFSLEILSSNYRSSIMPDSPDIKGPVNQTTTPPNSMAGLLPQPRPISNSSNISVMNGSHSPLSSLNGRTPSPPSMMNPAVGQQLPPACGARQLSKLKRFLTTLQQFGSDISPDIGERVRTLVLGLVNSHLSIEEFHSKLQEATNFPLRPFVIPFLKANLPLLQREMLHCARMAKQTPQQFLSQNEHVIFDAAHSPIESHDSYNSEFNDNGKRRSPERPKENGLDNHHDMNPAKRHHPMSPLGTNHISPNSSLSLNPNGQIRLEDISLSRELRERERLDREKVERERLDRERERERHFPNYNFSRNESFDPLERFDDDWRQVESMLHCIIGMVDKTKRALAVLQERSLRDREELSVWMRRHAEGMDQDVKKRTNDLMQYTRRQTEDKIRDVRSRAEAVNEVKRQAMLELQKAMTAAEQKASDLVATERLKIDRSITEAKKQAHEEVAAMINHQEESSESCWNCGRKASETCSGCNIARYCGSFCQHKDWENHHHVCGKSQVASIAEARDQRRSTTNKDSTVTSTPPPQVIQDTPSSPPGTVDTQSKSRPTTPTDKPSVPTTEAATAR